MVVIQSHIRAGANMITVIVYIVIIGVLLWLVNTYVPMADPLKKILNVVVVIGVILWLLSIFGILGPLPSPHIH